MYKVKNARNTCHRNKRVGKLQTNKQLDKLTYNPKKHKQKFTRKLRGQLQKKPSQVPASCKPPSTSLKFGSHNINGLDLEASWAVQELLKTRDFDVILIIKCQFQIMCFTRSWQ